MISIFLLSVKIEQILQTGSLSKETVTAIKILYKSTKAMVHSANNETLLCDTVARVLPGDLLALYLFIICGSWLSFDGYFILFYRSHSYRGAAVVPRSN